MPSTSSAFFNITATPIVTAGVSYAWYLEEINQFTGVTVPNTAVNNPNLWPGNSAVCTFYDYNYNTTYTSANNWGTVFGTAGSTTPGIFKVGKKYKITRAAWTSNPTCPYKQISATVQMTRNADNSTNFIIENEEITYGNSHDAAATLISENENAANLIISPNPSNGAFTISFNGTENENNVKSVFVYDITGKLVYKNEAINENTFELNISNEQKGMYFVKTVNGQSILSKKIIIQ